MSGDFGARLTVRFGRSVLLTVLLTAGHGGAALMAALAPLPWPARLALWFALGASLYRSLVLHALRRAPEAVHELVLEAEDAGMSLRTADGRHWARAVPVARFVHPTLTLLVVRTQDTGRIIPIAIAADAVDPQVFTRLRARLILARPPAPAG